METTHLLFLVLLAAPSLALPAEPYPKWERHACRKLGGACGSMCKNFIPNENHICHDNNLVCCVDGSSDCKDGLGGKCLDLIGSDETCEDILLPNERHYHYCPLDQICCTKVTPTTTTTTPKPTTTTPEFTLPTRLPDNLCEAQGGHCGKRCNRILVDDVLELCPDGDEQVCCIDGSSDCEDAYGGYCFNEEQETCDLNILDDPDDYRLCPPNQQCCSESTTPKPVSTAKPVHTTKPTITTKPIFTTKSTAKPTTTTTMPTTTTTMPTTTTTMPTTKTILSTTTTTMSTTTTSTPTTTTTMPTTTTTIPTTTTTSPLTTTNTPTTTTTTPTTTTTTTLKTTTSTTTQRPTTVTAKTTMATTTPNPTTTMSVNTTTSNPTTTGTTKPAPGTKCVAQNGHCGMYCKTSIYDPKAELCPQDQVCCIKGSSDCKDVFGGRCYDSTIDICDAQIIPDPDDFKLCPYSEKCCADTVTKPTTTVRPPDTRVP